MIKSNNCVADINPVTFAFDHWRLNSLSYLLISNLQIIVTINNINSNLRGTQNLLRIDILIRRTMRKILPETSPVFRYSINVWFILIITITTCTTTTTTTEKNPDSPVIFEWLDEASSYPAIPITSGENLGHSKPATDGGENNNTNSSSITTDHKSIKNIIKTKPRSRIKLMYEISFFVEAALVGLLNLIVMVMLLSNRKLRAKPAIKCFLSLQLTHVCLSVLTIAHSIDSTYTLLFSLITNGLLLESFFSMLILSAEKVSAIHFPFQHQVARRRKIFEILLLVSWLFSSSIPVLFVVVFKVNRDGVLYMMTVTMVLSFVVLTISNVLVLNTARKHVNAIRKTIVTQYPMKNINNNIIINNNNNIINNNISNNNNNSNDSIKNNRKNNTIIRHSKSILTSSVIIVTYLVLWLPYLVQNIIAIRENKTPSYNNAFTFAAVFVALLNGIVDPFIVIFFNRDVKELVRKSTSKRRRDWYLKDFYKCGVKGKTTMKWKNLKFNTGHNECDNK